MIRQPKFRLLFPMHADYLKAAFHYILPKQALTTLGGTLANVKTTAIKNFLIRRFIRKYDVCMHEAREENPDNYENFNAFFIRHIKPTCRPIADADIVSPVDGCISEIGRINKGQLLQAKGREYSIHQLLACDKKLSSEFENGLFATLYLSPKDYHRVHMPIEATLKEMIYVPGKLFSVQPTTTRMIPKLFACNERLVCFFDTAAGLMAMVLVGATVVGAIGTSWQGDLVRSNKIKHFTYPQNEKKTISLQQAAEMGYFKLGSTVILLFADGKHIEWRQDLSSGDKIQFGQALATIKV